MSRAASKQVVLFPVPRPACRHCGLVMDGEVWLGPFPGRWQVENLHFFEPRRIEQRFTCPTCAAAHQEI